MWFQEKLKVGGKIAFRSLIIIGLAALCALAAQADPLPSWKNSQAKTRILAFVASSTDKTSSKYVTPADRIAVFDNDGTLWAEQPVYFQLFYALDRLRELAEADPSILKTPALKAAANGDLKAALAGGKKALLEIVMASHSGVSVKAFSASVRKWLETAKHPVTGRRYDEMVYQPMLELLRYLRDKGFSTYIVSGGGIHFMRVFAEQVYGVPPEQVIGSTGKTSYKIIDGVPTIIKDPAIAFIDDKDGKPIAIDSKIGKRPILAGGNSDGDFEMLEWATSGDGSRLALLVHHTDSAREWAYDRESAIGRLDRGLTEAKDRGWLVIDMAADWKTIFPYE